MFTKLSPQQMSDAGSKSLIHYSKTTRNLTKNPACNISLLMGTVNTTAFFYLSKLVSLWTG